jgi:large exoprotein involved in heme utilization and adhesion
LVERNAFGNAGDITIDTGVLRVSGDNSLIFANTRGTGNAGNLNINASDSVTFIDNSSLLAQVQEGATGNSGDVSITTPSLAVRDFSLILTNTDGIGNAGNININTNDSLVIDRRSSISAGTTSQGNAGNIEVTTNSLSLSNFALLSANTRNNANGTAGQIVVNANNVNVSQGAIIGSFTETDFGFTGGTIAINAATLDVASGGNILTGSDGTGNAGDIDLNISNRLTIDGSNPAEFPPEFEPFQDDILEELENKTGLLASTTADALGDGGNININTNTLTVNNDAQISVSSQGAGNGGRVVVNAGELNLERRGGISAATSSGRGGEIFINLNDNLRLSNNSRITAQAFNNADGGNIDINANFVIAFPGSNNGSDIVANAEQGNGGNINITAESVFGIEERPLNDFTNDINASSEFGLSGNVLINTPDVDATQGIVELSSNVVEERDTVATACASERGENTSSLTIEGKGGIPPQPTAAFSVDNIAIDNQLSSETNERSLKVQSSQYPPILTARGAIYPARGVIVKPNGRIILTRYPTQNVDRGVIAASKNCSASDKK